MIFREPIWNKSQVLSKNMYLDAELIAIILRYTYYKISLITIFPKNLIEF